MKTLPNFVQKYKQTSTFGEANIPAGMLNIHSTKENVWGLIVIEEGELEYEIIQDSEKHVLNSNIRGVIEPTVEHRIRPLGAVKFHVEFYK
jgi:tellurite resistance-related uncharacterized protein